MLDTIHVHITPTEEWQTEIEATLAKNAQTLEKIMETIDTILDKVAAQGTVIDSVNTFVEAIQAEIKLLKLNPPDQAKIDAVFARLTANDQKLADAIVENVPPAGPPVIGTI